MITQRRPFSPTNVFQPRLAALFTLTTLGAYALVCLVANPAILTSSRNMELLVMRSITLAAMGGLGANYWRIQRAQRRRGRGRAPHR